MSRTVTLALQSLIEAESSTFCHVVTIERNTLSTLLLTSSDEDVVISGDTYLSAGGFTLSDISFSSSFSLQNLEIIVPLTDTGVRVEDIRAGEYDNQTVVVEMVDWNSTGSGTIVLYTGKISDTSYGDDGFVVFNLDGALTRTRPLAGEQYSPNCRNELGDSLCGFSINSTRFLFTVAASPAPGAQKFYTDATEADDYYSEGVVEWLSGNNTGIYSDIRKYTNSGGLVKIWTRLPYDISAGDTGYLYQGCPKTAAACKDTFDNLVNFRGEPFLPSQEVIPMKPEPRPTPTKDRPVKRPKYPNIIVR